MATETTTTTTTVTESRKGTGISVTSTNNTVTVGNFVTDVAIQPYIAQIIVAFFAYNMRPKQRVHIFFDGVNVDQYCAPGIVPAQIADTSDYNSIKVNGGYGDPIVTDAFGQVVGWFNIPAATFKTGDRVLTIADADSIIKGSDAITTSASATFTASNLSVTKQLTTLTTVNPQISTIPVTNSFVKSVSSKTDIVIHPEFIGTVNGSWHEPIAQGLTINTPNGDAGVFVTSLDLYFKQKSQLPERGVTVYLCETLNGYPNGSKVIPFSTVHLSYDKIITSEDASVPTVFVFDSPVYLNNGAEYAFVVKPDAGDPDYWVYSAKLGDVDVQTGKQMFSQPVVGTAFFGATDNQWTAIQDEYIKFQLFRARFNNQIGTASFVNRKADYITVENVSYACTSYDVLPGDYAFQSTNETIASINTSIKGIINSYDDVNGYVTLTASTGTFGPNKFIQIHRFANDSVMVAPGPNTKTLIAYANTGSVYNPKINALVPQFATITPAGTSLSFTYTGTSNSYSVDATEHPINIGSANEFLDKERIVASYSNELVNMSGNKSFKITASLSTDSDFISPVIDTVKKQQLLIANDVEPVKFIYDEFFDNGSAKSKYISQIVTLAGGQDAEDIQVILSGFRPVGTDIQVWIKFLNGEDGDSLSVKSWTPLINSGSRLFSKAGNTGDLKEFVFTVPKYYGMIPLTGKINATGTTVEGISTAFTTELKTGWYINMLATPTNQEVSRKIISIGDNRTITLDTAFNINYSNQPYFLVPPPTTPWLSDGSELLLTGTVTVSSSSATITGNSDTNFTGQLSVGSVIKINGDEQVVTGISGAHTLTVGKNWSSSGTYPIYLVNPMGVSYLNSTGALYTSFKKFQIKVVLQTNDSSQVPMIKDLRALALQL